MSDERARNQRAGDERLLEWLARRTAGETCRAIGEDFGISAVDVNKATRRVLDADIAESGEPVARVRKAYWSADALRGLTRLSRRKKRGA